MSYKQAVADRKQQKRVEVFNKTNGRCAYCGCELKLSMYGFHIDHIIPKRKYKVYGGDCYDKRWEYGDGSGSDQLDNLHASCKSCNSCKSDLSLEEFRLRIADRVRMLNDYSSEYLIAKRFGLVEEKDIEIVFYFEKLVAS